MFISNKYYDWYQQLIAKAQAENRRKNLGYDCHHIIPRSMGGTNVKTNLVFLTHREHFLAHVLLVKCVTKPYIFKMVSALVRFKNKAKSSRAYEMLRSVVSTYSKGEYNSSYGKMWCHNKETMDIMFLPKEQFEQMDQDIYQKGLPYQRGGYKDRIWINKEGKRAAVPESELQHYLDSGWSKGRDVILEKDHYVKMSSFRHTPEKDDAHRKKLEGRIHVINEQGMRKSVSAEQLTDYLQNGFKLLKGSDIKIKTFRGRPCSIKGTVYESAKTASTELGIKYHLLKGMIADDKHADCFWC